jgi:hypothetical protein
MPDKHIRGQVSAHAGQQARTTGTSVRAAPAQRRATNRLTADFGSPEQCRPAGESPAVTPARLIDVRLLLGVATMLKQKQRVRGRDGDEREVRSVLVEAAEFVPRRQRGRALQRLLL